MTAAAWGFLLACVWGLLCYRAGKKAAMYAQLKNQAKERVYVETVVENCSRLERDELLERLRNDTQK